MDKWAAMEGHRRNVKTKGIGYRCWKARYGYLFLVPVFLIMGIFKYYPAATAVVMSLFEWNGFNYREFIGLGNFISMWSDDTFVASLRNVAIFAAADIVKTLTVPLLAAELVYWVSSRKAKETYKFIFVLPMVVPTMVIILMWKWIYNPTFGALNLALNALGGHSNHAWLGSADTALISIIGVGFPWIGGIAFLIYLGGLQAIPDELHEAARIDGAGVWNRFLRIDLPLIAGQMKVLIILSLIQSMNSFENVLVLTNGGPGNYTMVPALHLYQQGITYNRMGYASAIGVIMFALIFVLTVISYQFKKEGKRHA
ncbi:carbohydrate ABC transporter permease [Paenibacillus thalictri]|nr:sugar ABC transporter permease [Paenibacillus thalictri]